MSNASADTGSPLKLTNVDVDEADLELESVADEISEAALERLQTRCNASGIALTPVDDPFEEGPVWVLQLPNGRDTTSLAVSTQDAANQLLSVPFEDFVVLGDYAAICSYREGWIEAGFRVAGARSPSFAERAILGMRLVSRPISDKELVTRRYRDPATGTEIVIGPQTPAFRVVSTHAWHSTWGQLSFRIENLPIQTHDAALSALKAITDAFFFQLELGRGVAIGLRRVVSRLRLTSRIRSEDVELRFPTHRYDTEPLDLYWYARNADGMPLLQFLAYYQVIEAYFGRYVQREAIARISRVLKEPLFRAEHEPDLLRLLRASGADQARSTPAEREQLGITLRACVGEDDLAGFIQADKELADFLAKDSVVCKSKRVSLKSEKLIEQVAERIYAIRCKVVHTKQDAGEDVSLLLPYSKEAENLHHDIRVVQFLARKALICSSRQLDATSLQ